MARNPRHPMQPLVRDPAGVVRFKANPIVRFLLETSTADLDTLARMGFDEEHHEQFAQLIGYSVSGFGELSYVTTRLIVKADKAAERLLRGRKGP